ANRAPARVAPSFGGAAAPRKGKATRPAKAVESNIRPLVHHGRQAPTRHARRPVDRLGARGQRAPRTIARRVARLAGALRGDPADPAARPRAARATRPARRGGVVAARIE